jgi:hypothetical protein
MAPMTPLPRRIAALATLLLAGAIVAVLTLRALGVPTPTGLLASVTSAPAAPTAVTSPSHSEDALDVFARIEQQVSELRGLPPPEIGPPDVISRDELVVELRAIFDETWTDGQLARDNLTLRAMGLLTEDQDIRQLTELLYAGQVLGFYDFDKRRMVVVTDAGITPEAQVTYAHEFTHAMQDAAFDTGRDHRAQGEDDDVSLARLALEEGDASVAMFQWAFQNLSSDELAEIGATPLPDTSGVPQWMIRHLEFPYLSGAQLVSRLWTSGGWEAVDAAYDHPPASTEQVLHPEKYNGGEEPVTVEPVDLGELLGDGWKSVEQTTVGEAMLAIWLDELGAEGGTAAGAAEGWGGDRLAVARGPNRAFAMAWRIVFDTNAQQDEFQVAMGDVRIPGHSGYVQTSGTEMIIVNSSVAVTAETIWDVLDEPGG